MTFTIFSLTCSSCDHQKLTSTESTTGKIPQEVYVWQRVWTDDVTHAVETRTPEFNNTVLLAAEISYQNKQWTCQPFHSPIHHSTKHPGEFGLAFRIHANAAKSKWSDSAIEEVSKSLRIYADHAKSIQIDYDCPSKKLSDYSNLLTHLKKEFPNKTLEITCLPDWLNYPEFASLVKQTDRFIMQVHGVSGHGKGRALCNTDHAYKTALTCAKFGKPYLMALPTYRHAISYGSDGKISNVASEGKFQKLRYEIASADPSQLSHLISEWQTQRPALMQGVIWYRLPVTSDRMNWTWETFQKVRIGEQPDIANLDLTITSTDDDLHHLTITNNTQQRLDWPEKVQLNWQGFCISSHLTEHYTIQNNERSKGMTMRWKHTSPYPIHPGETINIGSYRFTEKTLPIEISTP